MSKFKAGDRVAVYGPVQEIGTGRVSDPDGLCDRKGVVKDALYARSSYGFKGANLIIQDDTGGEYYCHSKQCRRLRKRVKPKDVFAGYNPRTGEVAMTNHADEESARAAFDGHSYYTQVVRLKAVE